MSGTTSVLGTTLPMDRLKVRKESLFVPDLDQVAKALQEGLSKNFAQVSVSVVDCPDLMESPYCLASSGLCGSPRILEIGGPPFMTPVPQKEKVYDMASFPRISETAPGKDELIIGAGAANYYYKKRNGEMMPNLLVRGDDGRVVQKTVVAYTKDSDGSYFTENLPETETRNSILGNFFLSEGKPGKVLEVRCKTRTGQDNLVSAMRKSLLAAFPKECVAMGGTFLVASGKLRIHVMPDFSDCPIKTDQELQQWLNFYEVSTPFVCLSVFASQDTLNLDLRLEHSHGYSGRGDGGHYHYDTTPDTVEYVGYFNVANTCYRVDAPGETHQIGRD